MAFTNASIWICQYCSVIPLAKAEKPDNSLIAYMSSEKESHLPHPLKSQKITNKGSYLCYIFSNVMYWWVFNCCKLRLALEAKNEILYMPITLAHSQIEVLLSQHGDWPSTGKCRNYQDPQVLSRLEREHCQHQIHYAAEMRFHITTNLTVERTELLFLGKQGRDTVTINWEAKLK